MDKTIIKPFDEIKYKVYGYTLPEVPSHEGYVKIGDTTRDVATRIFEQVGTAGLNPEILFEKQAQKSDGEWFRDKDLHRFLSLNGIEKKDFNQRADEWFYFNGYPEKAEELTDKYINLDYDESQIDDEHSDYVLRNEQQQAVEKTYEYYKSGQEPKEFLWNAKPRFGKTLTTYDFIRNLKATNVLIVTNRPAIANSWYDDFHKFIAWQEPQIKFISETDALKDKAFTRDGWLEFIDTTEYPNPSQITFISLQDLKGAKFAGGNYEKLEWVRGINWDLLVIDEAHEGVDTQKTDLAFSQLDRKFTLHLSGTPFKALANDKFSEEQIFNWSYVDEQEAKDNWDDSIGSNPYESLPTLNMFSYQMSKMVEDEVTEGISIDDEENVDYAFDLNEFFKVKDSGKFEYEESVIKFLDNLSSGKFSFAEGQYRSELNHTFWLLPRVNAAKALERLLKNHPIFKEYEVILAAGDGVSIENIEDEAMDVRKNIKSFTKVREAIKKHEKTITLSVGQLTTGVTIPEWTAVLMLNNIQSPSLYFQAAFRSQNPYELEKDGKLYRKENAYIFDFSPDRTLELYGDFATNLTGTSAETTEERKEKIKRLLNFFPVIAEDEEGSMHELDASEVLHIPTRITSQEVVKRGFMSNLLFANISGIFSGNSHFKEILDKIPPEKNKRLAERKKVEVTDPPLNEDGEVEIPPEITVGKSKDLFGDKIFETIDFEEIPSAFSPEQEKEEKEKSIKHLAKDITKSLDSGFENYKESFELSKRKTDDVKKSVNDALEDVIREKSLTFDNQMNEINKEYEKELQTAEQSNDEQQIKDIEENYEEKRNKAEQSFVGEVHKKAEETIHNVVEEEVAKEEESKKKTTEDDVRDHLRGFARTIPSFLMAYGDDHTELANFEENIDEETFEDLTSITINEFKKLRDGFEYVDDNGEEKTIPGLFNELVFNAGIQEFLDTKNRLANYFDDSLKEDIFDYIPPQKTNQIFTPKNVVKKMVDLLENTKPDIFKNKNTKFVDLYVKSGLYITEIVKRLYRGLRNEIPNQQERIKWILENQVYACAPSHIIFNIVKQYIFFNMEDISNRNIIQFDMTDHFEDKSVEEKIARNFGDDNLKFDVIIGNPPYHEMDGGAQSSARPLYHQFVRIAKELNPKLISFIIPTRWYAGGKGLDEFRSTMLNDIHIRELHDWITPADVFPNTNIRSGVCYFLWDINYNNENDLVRVVNYQDNKVIGDIKRPFKTKNVNVFIREHKSSSILSKVMSEEETMTQYISPRKPFGLTGYFTKDEKFRPNKTGLDYPVLCYGKGQKEGYVERDEVKVRSEWIDNWKVFTPRANNIGTELSDDNLNTFIGNPGTICTESYVVVGANLNLDETSSINLTKYFTTKFVRFLHSLAKGSQDATSRTYEFVPLQDFTNKSDIDWTVSIKEIEKQLYKKYGFTTEEIEHIDSRIKEM